MNRTTDEIMRFHYDKLKFALALLSRSFHETKAFLLHERSFMFTLLFIIPRTVLLAFIQPEAQILDFSTHALPRNL